MRIRVRPSGRRLDRITLQLASMVDVIFLLLIYFMVTTVLAKPEDRLSPTLQTRTQEAGGVSDFEPQIIDVAMLDGRPGYQLGATILRDKRELRAALRSLHKPGGVFIRVTDGVPVGFAMAAVQAGRDAGFSKVTYVPTQ